MKAVIYSRYSTDMQNAESVDQQEFACKKFADLKGYTIVKTYADEAISGKTDRRPALQQMLSDAKKGLFDTIICFSSDRMHRNIINYYAYKGQFSEIGVNIITIDNPSGNRIVEAVKSASADELIDVIAANVKRAHILNASKAKSTGGKPALGYDLDENKQFIINNAEAEIIRNIFEMRAEGKGYGAIIDMCKQKGYKTKSGHPFGKNSIHDLLINVKYIGVYRYGKVPRTKSGRRNSHQLLPENIIEIKDAIPAIVDQSTWNKVQEIIAFEKRMPAKYKAKVNYLLSGKIYCSCGSLMVGKRRTKHLKNGSISEYPVYMCNAKARQKICKSKDIPKREIESEVANYLFDTVLAADNIKQLTDKLNAELQNQLDLYASDREKYQLEFSDAKKSMENLMSLIKKAKDASLLIEEFDKEQERYNRAKFNLDSVKPPAKLTDKQVEGIIEVAQGKERTDELLQIIFNQFVDRVDISSTGEKKLTSKYRLETKSTGSTFDGAEGRTRTGTPSLTADFEFNSGAFRRYSMKLTTTLKVAYFTGAKPVLCSVFRPISPYFILGLGSQKVVKPFSS